jgi:hypothetical protein
MGKSGLGAGYRGVGTRREGDAVVEPRERTVSVMKRVVAIAACGLSLAGCSSLPSWMQVEMPKAAPVATTMQFESEPSGAEARTSLGQTCRTPCSGTVRANEFTVSFALPGYQPQTIPVRVVAPKETRDPNNPQTEPRLVPNPVFVELQPVAPPPPARKKPVARKKPKPAAKPAPTAMAPAAPPPPAPAPASPWPPAPAPSR